MAIFTSFDKNFEVTAISFSPNIITVGEETNYSISIKNTSGKKISGMYAQMQLYYRATDGAVHGSNSVFVYGGPTYDFKSISWASNATKTFTGKFVFTPLSSYPANIDTRLLPLFKGSDVGYPASFGGDERLGLFLNITTSNDLGDSWGNGDTFFDLRGENSEYLYVIDARYKPSISTFAAERSTGSEPDDEGENLLASIALGKSMVARPEFMSLYLYYQDKASPDIDPVAVDLSSLIDSALIAEIHTVISEILGKNADWNLVLWFGDKYESTTSAIEVSRSFANVHLSGASTGGACFGSFSKATEGNPMLECYYPAFFYGGINGVTNYSADEIATGGRWIDGKKIYRLVFVSDSVAGNAADITLGTIADLDQVISMNGTVKYFGVYFPLVLYRNDAYHHRVKISTAGAVSINVSNDVTASAIVVVEYTKSTEEASS